MLGNFVITAILTHVLQEKELPYITLHITFTQLPLCGRHFVAKDRDHK